MKALCPRCGSPVQGGDINIDTMTAVCRPCAEVFHLSERPTGGSLRLISNARLSLDDDRQSLSFSRREFRLLGLCLWAGAALATCTTYIAATSPFFGTWYALTTGGLATACTGLAMLAWLGRFRLEVNDHELISIFGLGPFARRRRFIRSDIAQLYVHQNARQHYDVYVQHRSGKTSRLFSNLHEASLAGHLVAQVEHMLGVGHSAVPGEFVPSPHQLSKTVLGHQDGLLMVPDDAGLKRPD